jgi:polyphosphate kinase 2 (PPK2 family)
MRAYGEINDVEARAAISCKRFRMTAKDWRKGDQWDLCESAVGDMVEFTSTEVTPWRLVPPCDDLMPVGVHASRSFLSLP